jgi:broad specificity phosphatase PhoE
MADARATYRLKQVAVVALVAVVIVGLWWWRCGGSTTLIVLRHADRAGAQDALTAEGLARAQTLVHMCEKAGVVAIYHSDTERTRLTAAPLAAALGLTPVELPATDIAGLANHIRANHPGRTVLVVGHSNTVPQLISAMGGPVIPDLADDEFDNLFVLEVCRCRWWPALLVNLQYGEPSP